MNDEVGQKQDGESAAGEAASAVRAVGTTRRRLLRGGAAVAPVILTFTSRPVLGFQQACVSPSRMISGNFSGFSGPTSCLGTSLTTRKAEAEAAEAAGDPKPQGWWDLEFAAIFSPAYTSKSVTPVANTLGAVFLDSFAGNDKVGVAQFAAYIIAAYLNSDPVNGSSSVVAVLSQAQVKHMWNDIVGGSGEYCPQISMCWNADGVVGYLKNSGIVPG